MASWKMTLAASTEVGKIIITPMKHSIMTCRYQYRISRRAPKAFQNFLAKSKITGSCFSNPLDSHPNQDEGTFHVLVRKALGRILCVKAPQPLHVCTVCALAPRGSMRGLDIPIPEQR
eukprot:scaffold684_cov345-Pavlova_lutheri.AAC.48